LIERRGYRLRATVFWLINTLLGLGVAVSLQRLIAWMVGYAQRSYPQWPFIGRIPRGFLETPLMLGLLVNWLVVTCYRLIAYRHHAASPRLVRHAGLMTALQLLTIVCGLALPWIAIRLAAR